MTEGKADNSGGQTMFAVTIKRFCDRTLTSSFILVSGCGVSSNQLCPWLGGKKSAISYKKKHEVL